MSYKIIKDFNQGNNPTTISVSPYWIVAIWRQKNPVTFQRSIGESFSSDTSKGVEVFSKPLILVDDCFQVSVNTNKNSYVSNLSMGLYPGEDYLELINPGDWICAWMVQSQEKFYDLIKRIKAKKACNKFDDGFKFFGKVANIRKQLIQEPNGPRRSRYTVSGTGMSEFDAVLYYNPYLAAKQDKLATQFGRFGYDINQLIEADKGGITSDLAIPRIVDVTLGKGTPANLLQNNPTGLKTTYGTEGESAYILPIELGKIIGKTVTTKRGGIGFADLVELVIGIQEYPNTTESSEDSTLSLDDGSTEFANTVVARSFQPNGTNSTGSRRFTDNKKLLGAFLPTSPSFTNKTVWNILREFLNPACNEMYATLRVNPDGNVVPTVVVRQLPFTSEFSNLLIPHTKFLNLPRWEIHPILIRSADIGRSDSLRFNFVDVLPISSSAGARNPAALTATFPPAFDSLDIARNGLRPYQQTIPAYGGDTRSDTTKVWKDLINDILMGQHMTLTGTITMVGVQSPICVGDNIEFDGVVYHIESVTHMCQIAEAGQKTFNTTLSLTHGINAKVNLSNTDLGIYAYTGLSSDDSHNNYDPASNSDTVNEQEKQEKRDSGLGDFESISDLEGLS